ncbi:Ribosomal protein S6 kinase delta-1 [Heterocephalus glaber]|uniref:Ribosomal protein S6 kinase delta-1 n=1 Tax=Heterocephalus glaber TaxID=10181 RepID=G5BCC9_HETGA|nr:Ribosomal protein S6 kinase delta-1 [Heterocephalus glaber]
MVCLHKYIISEELVFLVLQHTEGGKLWSYLSKFLNRSPEGSFDTKEVMKSMLAEVHLQQPAPSPQDNSCFESRGSDRGGVLRVLPLKTSLTPSSQEDSNQEDNGQHSSPKWPDSGSSSEEDCTTSYLTLCNEYGQEKIEPRVLNEEPFVKTKGKDVGDRAVQPFSACLVADSANSSTQLRAHKLKFFLGDEDSEALPSPRTSNSLSRSKTSPMEFFRIDSKDSTNEFLGLNFGEKLICKLATSLFQRNSETKGESGLAVEGDKEIHQIFEDLDKKLALNSRFYIPEDCIQRWAGEMVVALDALHRQGIVCRDLNPNNILLNDRGHIQLMYFSRWSEVEDSCDSDAIERMYCAPEVGAITGETEACDWWSLGTVLFKLLTGKTLVECHPEGINTHITLNMPENVSGEARSLIQQLLKFNPLEHLGAGVACVEDIKSHPFFTPVDWAALMR